MVRDSMSRKQRIGGGLLFLLIALAVLFVQPFENQLLIAAIGAINLLISALLFATIGADTVGRNTYFDVPTWAISVLYGTAVYALVSLGLGGVIDTLELVTFMIGFGIGLAVFTTIRERFRRN